MKISDKLNEKTKAIQLMGHVIAYFPDYNSSLAAAKGIIDGGVDYLEVQFPFSDPTADGPAIEGACYRALESGFNVEEGFKLAGELVEYAQNVPILIMTYANIIFHYGMEGFIKKAKSIGVSGFIIPDLPPDADEGLNKLALENGLDNVVIVTPGADAERIRYLSEAGSGFLYTVIRRGITGEKTDFNDEAYNWLELVKNNSFLPIAAAFGIKENSHIMALQGKAPIAVIGSHFVRCIDKAVSEKGDIYKYLKEETATIMKGV